MPPRAAGGHAPRARRRRALLAAPAVATAAIALAGCGGGSKQNAGEPSASFRVRVLHASFPALQSVAKPVRMTLAVRNAGLRTVPNLAITVDSFTYRSTYPGLASPQRPIWVIERGPGTPARPPVSTQEVNPPGGGQTAYVSTWALGPVPPGRTVVFSWKVVPVKPGLHFVHYSVAAGLGGNATARMAGGGPARGVFIAHVAGEPPITHVDPQTGKVVPGPYPGESENGAGAGSTGTATTGGTGASSQ